MAVTKKSLKNNHYRLKGSLKKTGFDSWRYYFSGTNSTTGEERFFYIELIIENPMISQNSVILFQKPEVKINSEDLQRALSGNLQLNSSESSGLPSFCAVRAGVYGAFPKQLNQFYPVSDFKSAKKEFNIQVGDCQFTDSILKGSVSVSKEMSRSFPEYMSDIGRLEWNLQYERSIDFKPLIGKKESEAWFPTGLATRFSGRISLDGSEYVVVPEKCFGYSEKNWGKSYPIPYLHVSSSKLTSEFTGKLMRQSGFTVQGNYFDLPCVHCSFEGKNYSFGKTMDSKILNSNWNCIRGPMNDDEEQLHWTVSISNKKTILDIDIFCPVSSMIVRDYELPEGNHKILKVLSGGSGLGEIRMYKQFKNSIEMIQHAKVENALCEYGVLDVSEEE